ncbi:MAG: DMT family transporter, partial [Bacteroidales bacterium]|nr:DMT family transporter [Bacteroidales bacterium]
MENIKTEANISMIISRTFSGLNMNALKYLLPFWLSPLTGVTFRCMFAAIAFWIISFFTKPETSTAKEKWILFLLGAIGIYGYMFFYLIGISKTTPISSSIFTSMQPIWVFLIAVFFLKEKITSMKIIGILIGFGGALLCISTQKSDDLASDAFIGNIFCLASSVMYAIYLVLSHLLLKSVGIYTMLKYTFTGAAVSSVIVTAFTVYDALLFSERFHWFPVSILLFFLIFHNVIIYLLFPIGLKYLKTT